jgi:hypothetical protein
MTTSPIMGKVRVGAPSIFGAGLFRVRLAMSGSIRFWGMGAEVLGADAGILAPGSDLGPSFFEAESEDSLEASSRADKRTEKVDCCREDC